MQPLLRKLHEYCRVHSSTPNSDLLALERETHLKTLAPQMISGPLQGQFLAFVSQMIAPRTILEIGTFTGYSSLNLAKGLTPGGVLHTIEANPEIVYLARKYIIKAGLEHRINLHVGRAEEIIERLTGPFDLVFIDGGKHDYSKHFDLVIDRVSSGGFILADNVLWSGKVIANDEKWDKDTELMHAFNQKIRNDPRVENLILPLRDGLAMIRKI